MTRRKKRRIRIHVKDLVQKEGNEKIIFDHQTPEIKKRIMILTTANFERIVKAVGITNTQYFFEEFEEILEEIISEMYEKKRISFVYYTHNLLNNVILRFLTHFLSRYKGLRTKALKIHVIKVELPLKESSKGIIYFRHIDMNNLFNAYMKNWIIALRTEMYNGSYVGAI